MRFLEMPAKLYDTPPMLHCTQGVTELRVLWGLVIPERQFWPSAACIPDGGLYLRLEQQAEISRT